MTKYLIRRRNRWGQWAHIATLDYPPSRQYVETTYGPGEYSIMVAEEGMRGLQGYANYSIPYSVELLEWSPDKPTADYVAQKWGEGNYFIAGRASDIQPLTVAEKRDKMVEELMSQGIGAVRKGYVILRLTGMPYH